MGLSNKQASSDCRHDRSKALLQSSTMELPKSPPLRRQQQQTEPLRCPRCGSTNTKFCYYNNYNKSQPRHLCKACKRHWTRGGTLRDVPVGGGSKNKRLKTSNIIISSSCSSTATNVSIVTSTTRSLTPIMHIRSQYQSTNLVLDDQSNMSDIIIQDQIHPPSTASVEKVYLTTIAALWARPYVYPK